MDGSLESGLSTTGQQWDQFEANERMFGTTSSYNEDIYTTTINRNDPGYKAKVALAERLQREINSTAPATSHVAEERIMDFSGAGDQADEEEKYACLYRSHLATC